jgi:hypothetical protein
MDFTEIGQGMDWIHLDKDRHKWQALMNTMMKLQVLQNAVLGKSHTLFQEVA